MIEKISKEDEKLAKKYNISPAKAAYINFIIKDNKSISIKKLIDKSVKELSETKNTGRYCDEGYMLDGDFCFREVERIRANSGKVCPKGYSEYEGICYKESQIKEGNNYVCHNDFQLVNNKCIKIEKYEAIGKCKNGKYDNYSKKCIEKRYIGEAEEYCRLTPETDLLMDHKCYGPKPTINGGCLGSDRIINGKCVDMNSYYESDWICRNGGEITYLDKNGDHKCYEEKRVDPVSYYCENNDRLNEKECTREEVENAQKERICSNGYTLVNNSNCINYNKTANKEDGLVCEGENSKLKGNTCIIYEIVEAKSN